MKSNEQHTERNEVKYIRELQEYWTEFVSAVIAEIFVGVSVNLGMDEKEAYSLSVSNPAELKKSIFDKTFERFKNIFSYTIPKFRIRGKRLFGGGKPLSPAEWNAINNYIDKYWNNTLSKVNDDVTAKAFLAGINTAKFRRENVPYQDMSLYQLNFDQYKGKMPRTIESAYKAFDFENADNQERYLSDCRENIAIHVQNTKDDVKEAIRVQVKRGLDDGKSATQIASDLYWQVEKDPDNKFTADRIKKNWKRIAITEMQSVYEAAALSQYEGMAAESLKDSSKAQYFVFTGGTCDWCTPRLGTLVRLIPKSLAKSLSSDRLSDAGIKDPNTDIAVWVGKNNVGLKKKDWMICTPAHPHNAATLSPIDLANEYYDEKDGRVKRIQKKSDYIPQQKRVEIKNERERISDNTVKLGDNTYTAVSHSDYDRKLSEWKKNRTGAIPVDRDSTDYIRIFREGK
jgi:hypothetical protein